MRKKYVIAMTILFCLLPATFYAAEKDAAGCKDHPLIPRMPGYYIAGCNETPAGADLDIIKGETTESVHFEGKSIAFTYMPQPELKTKPSEAELRSHFENTVKKLNGSLFGITYGQQWPVYTAVKDGKNFWIILLINSGKYFTGSYSCRIIEKK
jgi:OmpA-OmpF porin, OOP family